MKLKFCDNCQNLLYIDKKKNNNLVYKCKNCDFKLEEKNPFGCIYSNTNNTSFLTHTSINNSYLKYDPTLPRINTMKCINDKCVSNTEFTNLFILSNLNIHSFNFDDRLEELKSKYNIEIIKDGLEKYTRIVLLKNIDQRENLELSIKEWHSYFKFNNVIKPLVIFIKYDPENLKYIYICNYCNTSWKND
jgi:DNA-directed RNA polymerase subunit M/transcription elongation factor TFIIS